MLKKNKMNIDQLTIGEAKQLASLFGTNSQLCTPRPCGSIHQHYLGRRCLIRTFSAGVHIGTVEAIDETGMQIRLKDTFRLWKWEGGGLSLSSVATNGIKGGKLDRAPEVGLTNCIEIIPTTREAEASYAKYVVTS